MTAIRELLKDADPMRHETPGLADRERVRRAVMTAAHPPASGRPPARRRIALLAIAAGAALVAAVGARGVRVWPGDTTLHAAAVRFEIRLAESEPTLGLAPARVAGSDRTVYLHRETVVTNDDIAAARVVAGGAPQEFNVTVMFVPSAAEKMRAATVAHIGRPLALMLDDEVVMAPIVRSPIAAEAVLTGHYTYAEASRIAGGMLVR